MTALCIINPPSLELSASLAVVLIPSWEQLVAGGFERRAGSVLGTGHWKRL